jgi:serine/threonine protein kinase
MDETDIWIPSIDDRNFKIVKLISNTSLYGVIFKVLINGQSATLKVDFRRKDDSIGNKEVNNEADILEYITLYEPKLTTEFYDFQMLSDSGKRSLYDKMNMIPNWTGYYNKPDYETAVKDYNIYVILMEYLGQPWIELNTITNELLENQNSANLRKLKIIYESVRKNINKLHNLKFVHCDLHSGNIMINTNNWRENKIIDFGRSFNSGDNMWNKEITASNPYTSIKCNETVANYINELCGLGGQIPCTDE